MITAVWTFYHAEHNFCLLIYIFWAAILWLLGPAKHALCAKHVIGRERQECERLLGRPSRFCIVRPTKHVWHWTSLQNIRATASNTNFNYHCTDSRTSYSLRDPEEWNAFCRRVLILWPFEGQKCESTFLFSASRLPKEHCFWKVSRVRPFVLLVRATCRER
jgi:hypothetical protein